MEGPRPQREARGAGRHGESRRSGRGRRGRPVDVGGPVEAGYCRDACLCRTFAEKLLAKGPDKLPRAIPARSRQKNSGQVLAKLADVCWPKVGRLLQTPARLCQCWRKFGPICPRLPKLAKFDQHWSKLVKFAPLLARPMLVDVEPSVRQLFYNFRPRPRSSWVTIGHTRRATFVNFRATTVLNIRCKLMKPCSGHRSTK